MPTPLFKKLNVLFVTSLYISECLMHFMHFKSNFTILPTNSIVHNNDPRLKKDLIISQFGLIEKNNNLTFCIAHLVFNYFKSRLLDISMLRPTRKKDM